MAHPKESPFSKHTHEFREQAVTLGHNVHELGRVTKEIAHDSVQLLRENASDYIEEGVKSAKKMEKNLENKIRENPLRSLLIAAGVGLAVGFLWKRR